MDYKSQTCCFTGHRDIAPYTPDTVFEQTKAVVTLLVSKGFKYFGTGGALGFDTLAAQAVLSVKETHPEVKLILVLPCENQTKFWKQQDIDVYNDIKLRADKVRSLLRITITVACKKGTDTLLIAVLLAFAFLQGIKAARHTLLIMQNKMVLI